MIFLDVPGFFIQQNFSSANYHLNSLRLAYDI